MGVDWCLLREEIKRKVTFSFPCSQKVAEVVNTLIDTQDFGGYSIVFSVSPNLFALCILPAHSFS
jgi:hypothetical protein